MNKPNYIISCVSIFFKYLKVAYLFASSDIKSRYNSTFLGSTWLTLNLVIPAVFLSTIWVIVLQQNLDEFVPHFVIGFVIWQTISSWLVSSSILFIKSSQVMKITPVPVYFFTQELMMSKLFEARAGCLVLLSVGVLFGETSILNEVNFLFFMLGLFLTIAFTFTASHVIAFLGAKYSDVEQVVSNVISIAFFCTPIIYMQERLLEYQFLLFFNPFYYIVEAIRQPMLVTKPDPFIYLILAAITLMMLLLCIKANKKWSGECPLWV